VVVDKSNGPDLATLVGLGAATAAILLVGMGLGWLVDEVLDTLPVFTLVGLVFGIVGACVYIYGQFSKFLKE
jgi:F0F1-type ATP synthase assembly protein I